MVSIAREILLHDKLRFVITVVSLGFAIVMMVYDVGMFFGVTGDSVNLIDRAHAGVRKRSRVRGLLTPTEWWGLGRDCESSGCH